MVPRMERNRLTVGATLPAVLALALAAPLGLVGCKGGDPDASTGAPVEDALDGAADAADDAADTAIDAVGDAADAAGETLDDVTNGVEDAADAADAAGDAVEEAVNEVVEYAQGQTHPDGHNRFAAGGKIDEHHRRPEHLRVAVSEHEAEARAPVARPHRPVEGDLDATRDVGALPGERDSRFDGHQGTATAHVEHVLPGGRQICERRDAYDPGLVRGELHRRTVEANRGRSRTPREQRRRERRTEARGARPPVTGPGEAEQVAQVG